MDYLRLLKSDFIKVKRTPFMWIHIGIPLLGILLFFSYALARHADTDTIMLPYIQILGVAFPFLIGLICAFLVEQEANAGSFKELIGNNYGRAKSIGSKLRLAFIFGFFSVALSVFGLEVLLLLSKKGCGNVFPYLGRIVFLLFVTQIVLYIFHLFISLQFGKGPSIAVGIAETLVAALMLTGLGDGIWQWIPCSYGVRVVGVFLLIYVTGDKEKLWILQWRQGILFGTVFIVIATILFFLWFSRYEGRNAE